MSHDPWITWMDSLPLLEHEHAYVRLGAIAVLERLARDPELTEPTVEVLRSALKEWENKVPGPPEDVKSAAQRLLTSLEDQGRASTDGTR